MKRYIFILVYVLTIVSCTSEKTVKGDWYGTRFGAPMSVQFSDSIMDIHIEASSNMSLIADYVISNADADTFHIDLSGSGIMLAQGIGIYESPESLTLAFTFGGMGQLKRPKSVEEAQSNLAGMVLKLSRNKQNAVSVVDQEVKAPKEAQLAFERNRRLGHGINLNNVVDGNSHEGNPADQPFTEKDAKRIADAGFNSVRLPVCWVKHALPRAPYTIDPSFFAKVDSIVDLCLKNGLAISLDVHYYPQINMHQPDSILSFEENMERLPILWAQIAEHFKERPVEVYFDLLNEPNPIMDNDTYNGLMAKVIKTVRVTNPNRTLILGTPALGQHWTIGELRLPKDDWNIIVQTHYYLPHTFTHQGLSYAPGAEKEGVAWLGSEKEKLAIATDFDYLARWSQLQHRPVNVGEFGVVETADHESKVRYMGYLSEIITNRNMSYHIWGYREVFHINNPTTGEFDPDIIKALKNE